MKLGVHLVNFSLPGGPETIGPTLAATGRAAEEAGLDNLSFMDHYLQLAFLSAVEDPMLEGYTVLGFLAGHTTSVQLQLLMTGVTYRHPGLLAKIVSTLDVLSGGRAALGIGAAWYEREHRALGVPFPPVAERFERLEETLQIADRMWAGDETPFEGRRYRLGRPQGSPGPAGHARPPVLIGGAGERRTLRLVARYADACNLFDIPDGGRTVRHKLEVLARHCEELGRPYEAIEKTLSTRLEVGEPAEEFVRRSVAAAALGIEHMVVISSHPWTAEGLSTLAAAVPALREVGR
jgi:F420-dependent oxidoreductase-like protein